MEAPAPVELKVIDDGDVMDLVNTTCTVVILVSANRTSLALIWPRSVLETIAELHSAKRILTPRML